MTKVLLESASTYCLGSLLCLIYVENGKSSKFNNRFAVTKTALVLKKLSMYYKTPLSPFFQLIFGIFYCLYEYS